jgi:hypothetical protein
MKSFDVDLVLSGNTLSANVTNVQGFEDAKRFYFYLLRYGQIVHRSVHWSDLPTTTYDLRQSGTYTVQAHVKDAQHNTHLQAQPLFYCTPADHLEFSAFVESSIPQALPALPIYHPKFPYGNILADIQINSEAHTVPKFPGKPQSSQQLQFSWGSVVAYSDFPLRTACGCDFIFSGVAKSDASPDLQIGYKEVNDPLQLKGAIGSFAALIGDHSRDTLLAHTDFFGISKLYFYNADSRCIVSNNYHLLLQFLRSIGVALRFRTDLAEAHFVFANVQPFHQSFTDALDIEGIYMLPVDSQLECHAGRLDITCSEISTLLKSTPALHSGDSYHRLVAKACDEVVDNCACVFARSELDHVVIDVSGGLDSRMVLAAALKCDPKTQRPKLNIKYSPREPNDHLVACSLNSFVKLPYDDICESHVSSDSFNDTLSFYLGQYYSYNPVRGKKRLNKTVRLVGFFGEITARPYYARFMFDQFAAVESIDDFVDLLLKKFQGHSWIGCPPAFHTLRTLLAEQLRRIPGDSPLERYEHLYLFYRNRLHCCDHLRADYSCQEWGPLQSKSLFALKRATFHHHRGIQLQLDCIQHLNKILSDYPYQFAPDEEARINPLQSSFSFPRKTNTLVADSHALERELLDWNRAKQQKQAGTSECHLPENMSSQSGVDAWRDALSALKQLRQDEVLSEPVTQSLWYIFQEFREKADFSQILTYYRNRLLSLYYQREAIS